MSIMKMMKITGCLLQVGLGEFLVFVRYLSDAGRLFVILDALMHACNQVVKCYCLSN